MKIILALSLAVAVAGCGGGTVTSGDGAATPADGGTFLAGSVDGGSDQGAVPADLGSSTGDSGSLAFDAGSADSAASSSNAVSMAFTIKREASGVSSNLLLPKWDSYLDFYALAPVGNLISDKLLPPNVGDLVAGTLTVGTQSVSLTITTPATPPDVIAALETSIGAEIDGKTKGLLWEATAPITAANLAALQALGFSTASAYIGSTTASGTGTHRAHMLVTGLPFVKRLELGAPF